MLLTSLLGELVVVEHEFDRVRTAIRELATRCTVESESRHGMKVRSSPAIEGRRLAS